MKTHIKSIRSHILSGSVVLLASLLWAGHSVAQNAEFRYQVVNDSTLKVGFWNNSYYTKGRAQDLVFEKIANLVLQQGGHYFELEESQVSTDYVATSAADGNSASASMVKTNLSEPPSATREWSKNGTIVFPRYFFTTQVKWYKVPPADATVKLYNARNVVLRQQYIDKPFKSVKHHSQNSDSAPTTQGGTGSQSTETGKVSVAVADWTNKSYNHLQKSEWADAIRTASAAINLNKNFDIPYVNRATAYIKHGEIDKASNDIDTALALNPNNALALNMKGYLYQQGGKMDDAMRLYSKACEKKLELGCTNYKETAGFRPDSPKEQAEYYLEQSAKAMEYNRWDEVIQWSSKAIEADPNNFKAYSNRAGALAETGRSKEAILDADQAIALNPDFGPAYHNRGHAYKVMGDLHDAALEFEIGCKLGVSDSCTEFKNVNSVASK